MQASCHQRGNVTMVKLNGRLDYESGAPFRKMCLEALSGRAVVFDLGGLNFVGSRGLSEFARTLEQMSQTGEIRFCGVSSEFRRLFQASGFGELHFWESAERALASLMGSATSEFRSGEV